jgi:hypothetical protein
MSARVEKSLAVAASIIARVSRFWAAFMGC